MLRCMTLIALLTNSFTVVQNAHFSFRGAFSEVFVISLKVEKADYEKAVQWIRDLVTGAVFNKERYGFAPALAD